MMRMYHQTLNLLQDLQKETETMKLLLITVNKTFDRNCRLADKYLPFNSDSLSEDLKEIGEYVEEPHLQHLFSDKNVEMVANYMNEMSSFIEGHHPNIEAKFVVPPTDCVQLHLDTLNNLQTLVKTRQVDNYLVQGKPLSIDEVYERLSKFHAYFSHLDRLVALLESYDEKLQPK